jgi:Flp pilus assembly CpaE family ATPase
MPGLSISLGVDVPDDPPLNQAAEQNEKGRWRLKPGIGPVRAVQRFATDAPDGVRLLQIGKTDVRGLAPIRASHNAFYQVVHRLEGARALRDWVILGDLPAGARQAAFDWAPYAQHFLLVVEPTWQSMLTARRIARIARGMRPDAEFSLVVNKVAVAGDVERVQEFLGVPLIASVPADDGVRSAERAGAPLLDHAPGSAAVHALEGLAAALDAANIEQ